MNLKIKFFENSMKGMIVGQAYMVINIMNMLTCAFTANQVCGVISTYYEKLPDQDQLSYTKCVATRLIYILWFLVCIVTIVIRIFALQYLWRSWKVLNRKEDDKKKRKQREYDKKIRQRRLKKREMQKALADKRTEFRVLRNKISKSIRAEAFGGGMGD